MEQQRSGAGGGGCGNTNGCQLGAWVTTNGGMSWTFMAGSQGGALRQCSSQGTPTTPLTLAITRRTGTARGSRSIQTIRTAFSIPTKSWFATRTGTIWLTKPACTYNQSTAIVFMWTITPWRLFPAHRASFSKAMTVASTGLLTPMPLC